MFISLGALIIALDSLLLSLNHFCFAFAVVSRDATGRLTFNTRDMAACVIYED